MKTLYCKTLSVFHGRGKQIWKGNITSPPRLSKTTAHGCCPLRPRTQCCMVSFAWGWTHWQEPDDQPWGVASAYLWQFLIGAGNYWPEHSRSTARSDAPDSKFTRLMGATVVANHFNKFLGQICPLADLVFGVWDDMRQYHARNPMTPAENYRAEWTNRLREYPAAKTADLGLVSCLCLAIVLAMHCLLSLTMLVRLMQTYLHCRM